MSGALADRATGCLLGLAVGDALGWPAARHRAGALPPWTRRLARELDTFAEESATTTLPVPFALNQPPRLLATGPSDDAEWAAFTAMTVLASPATNREGIERAWISLSSGGEPLRARISVRAALANLADGLRPPVTGHDNPHHFDDAACCRAVVHGLLHPGDPAAAAESAAFDAAVTNSGDGVSGARAMAAAVAVAVVSTPDCPDGMVAAALAELPEDSEVGRNARRGLEVARTQCSPFALVPVLEEAFVDHVYSYAVAAAETVPLALALVSASGGDFTQTVTAAACLPRLADSLPALAGGLAGALGGARAVPEQWRRRCHVLAGCCLPRVSGVDLVELGAQLAQRSEEREGASGT